LLPALPRRTGPDRGAAGRLRRARRSQEGDRTGAWLPLATLHRPLPQGGARPRPPRTAADARRPAPPDLQRRLGRAVARAGRRRARAPTQAATEGGGASRAGRGRPARLLRLPERALAEAPQHQPARACQPRDRPAHRRRRHLPQRPLADPARRQRRHRTNDEWLVGHRYLSNHSLEAVLDQENNKDQTREEARELTTT